MLAKIPLGIFVPKYRKESSRPEDFPYDPYRRSVTVIVLSMLCRGEFNFLVASVGLSEGLLSPDLYSAVVFAILTSSIFIPVILSKVLDYYQRLNREYMAGSHPAKLIGNNAVETAPLYITVEANTHNKWGLQENFQRVVENAGLIIIDHRSYRHGDDIQTRIFAQDQIARVRIDSCSTETKVIRYHNTSPATTEDGQEGHSNNNNNQDEETPKEEPMEKRIDEIRAGKFVSCCFSIIMHGIMCFVVLQNKKLYHLILTPFVCTQTNKQTNQQFLQVSCHPTRILASTTSKCWNARSIHLPLPLLHPPVHKARTLKREATGTRKHTAFRTLLQVFLKSFKTISQIFTTKMNKP